MVSPPIRDGAVAFQGGRIREVGARANLLRLYPNTRHIERRNATLLPGLVNAHTHLELSEMPCRPRQGDFVDWLLQLIPRGQITLEDIHASVARSIPIGMRQCLRFGVTTVGDISRHCTVSRPLLKDGPLRVVSYGEIQAMAQRRQLLESRLETASEYDGESDSLKVGISPHAPYSVEIPAYERCVERATLATMPMATHLSESADEEPFLASHSGRFRDLWNELGAWDNDVPTFTGGPIRMAQSVGLLSGTPRSLLAHVNYCSDDELDILAAGKASVVYCPRTHAYFGHPPHRWREMLQRGINVAIGTDSCASSPDLNPVDELRLLRKIAPDFPGEALWKLATVNAAEAIGMADSGQLGARQLADFVLFEQSGDKPLEAILDSTELPFEVWVGGDIVSLP